MTPWPAKPIEETYVVTIVRVQIGGDANLITVGWLMSIGHTKAGQLKIAAACCHAK